MLIYDERKIALIFDGFLFSFFIFFISWLYGECSFSIYTYHMLSMKITISDWEKEYLGKTKPKNTGRERERERIECLEAMRWSALGNASFLFKKIHQVPSGEMLCWKIFLFIFGDFFVKMRRMKVRLDVSSM